jgi:hypothetical protein
LIRVNQIPDSSLFSSNKLTLNFYQQTKMSGQNTPLSKTLSSQSLSTPRVSIEAIINSDKPGIKTLLAEYFSGAKLFAKIRHTDSGITAATVQGHAKLIYTSLEYLKELLLITYDAAIVWSEECIVGEENILCSVTIENTPAELKRGQSSGEFLEKHFKEISFGGSATTENLKKIAQQTFASMAGAATGFGVAKGWIPAVKKEHISLKYKEQRYDMEVSTIQSLELLLQAVEKKLQIPQTIDMLYRIEDGDFIVVTDVKDLREGCLYFALTVNEELPKKQTAKFSTMMEEFFERLKTEQELDDDDVQTIKDCFGNQKIKFKQLLATGELAITDEKLKDYGITQGGLRTAILSVIKSNV